MSRHNRLREARRRNAQRTRGPVFLRGLDEELGLAGLSFVDTGTSFTARDMLANGLTTGAALCFERLSADDLSRVWHELKALRHDGLVLIFQRHPEFPVRLGTDDLERATATELIEFDGDAFTLAADEGKSGGVFDLYENAYARLRYCVLLWGQLRSLAKVL